MNTQYEYPEQYAKHPMTYSEGLGEQTIAEYAAMVEGFALETSYLYGWDPDQYEVLKTVDDWDPQYIGMNHLVHFGIEEDSKQFKNYQRMCEMIQGCYAAMTEAYDSTYREIIGFTVEGPIEGEWQMPNPFDRRYHVSVLFAGNEKPINIPMSYFEETWGAISIMKKMAEDYKKKEDENE